MPFNWQCIEFLEAPYNDEMRDTIVEPVSIRGGGLEVVIVRPAMCLLLDLVVLGKDQRSIRAAKAKRIGHGNANSFILRL